MEMLVGFNAGEDLGTRAGPVDNDFFDMSFFPEPEMEPAGRLGEEGLSGVKGSDVRDGLAFEVDFDTGSDGVARSGFSSACEVERKEF